jgi:prevent-host-death family protein
MVVATAAPSSRILSRFITLPPEVGQGPPYPRAPIGTPVRLAGRAFVDVTKRTKSTRLVDMERVSIHEAKTHFSRLVRRAEAGEEIVVRRGSKPVAKIVPYRAAAGPRVPGRLKGRVRLAPDFDDTPPGFDEYLP